MILFINAIKAGKKKMSSIIKMTIKSLINNISEFKSKGNIGKRKRDGKYYWLSIY